MPISIHFNNISYELKLVTSYSQSYKATDFQSKQHYKFHWFFTVGMPQRWNHETYFKGFELSFSSLLINPFLHFVVNYSINILGMSFKNKSFVFPPVYILYTIYSLNVDVTNHFFIFRSSDKILNQLQKFAKRSRDRMW